MRFGLPWLAGAMLLTTITVGLPKLVVPPPAPGDSADTGADTAADTAVDTSDTADTSEPVDTSEPDTFDPETGLETGDSGPEVDSASGWSISAAERAGEKGEFGCSAVPGGLAGAVWGLGLALAFLRRRDD